MYTVLLVDDEPGLLELGKAFLEMSGDIRVATALSAGEAIDALRHTVYDCIVSDYQMPLMDGLEFLKSLRSEGNEIAFILFTGRGREEVVIEAVNSGVDFYLQKGGDPKPQFVELQHKIRLAVNRRRTEIALKESEERYRDVVEDQTELISRFLPDGTHVFVNGAYCRYFAKTPEEIIGSRFHPNVPKEDLKQIRDHIRGLSPLHPYATMEHRIIMPDGTIRWQQWSDRAIFDREGQIREYQSVGRDITEKRAAEDELRSAYEQVAAAEEELHAQFDELREREQVIRESERKLQGIVHGSPIPQFVIDKNHRVISWNHALEVASGRMAAEILGTTDAWKAFYPGKRPVLAEILVDDTPQNVFSWYEGKISRSKYVDGAYDATDYFLYPGRPGIWLHFTAAAIRDDQGKIIGAVETLEDITELKEKEVALTEARNYLDKIMNAIPDPVFVKDRNHRWVLMNDSMCGFMGHEREELIGKSDYDFFPKEEADVFWQKDELVFFSGAENTNQEQLTDAAGQTHTILTKKTLYTDQSGNSFIVGVIRDITERRKAEEALLASEEKYRDLFTRAGDVIAIIDGAGIILDLNEKFDDETGYSRTEMLGKNVLTSDILTRNSARMVAYHIRQAFKGNIAPVFQIVGIHKDGSKVTYEVRLSSITREGKIAAVQAILRNLAERKQAEEVHIRGGVWNNDN